MPELGTSMTPPVVWTPSAPTPNHLHEEAHGMRGNAGPASGPLPLDLLADDGLAAMRGDASMPATDDETDDTDASTDLHACSQQNQPLFAATQDRTRLPANTPVGRSISDPVGLHHDDKFAHALAAGGGSSGTANYHCGEDGGNDADNDADNVFTSPFDDATMDMDMDFAAPATCQAGISGGNEAESDDTDDVDALLPPTAGTLTPPTTTATEFAFPMNTGPAKDSMRTPALYGGGSWVASSAPSFTGGADNGQLPSVSRATCINTPSTSTTAAPASTRGNGMGAPTSTAVNTDPNFVTSMSRNPELQSQFTAILEALTSAGMSGSAAAAAGEMARGSSPSMFSSWSGNSDAKDAGQQHQQHQQHQHQQQPLSTTTAPATTTGEYSCGIDEFDNINTSELFGSRHAITPGAPLAFNFSSSNGRGGAAATKQCRSPQAGGSRKAPQHKQLHNARKTRSRGRSRGSKRDPRHKLCILMQAMPRESVAKMRDMVGKLQPHALRPDGESPRFNIDYSAIEDTALSELLKAAKKEPKLHKLSTSPRMGRRNASKVCDSCHTTKTPVWREADNRYFCNACGLRYHKLMFRCPNIACRYVPHHADLGKPCSRCGQLLPRSPTAFPHRGGGVSSKQASKTAVAARA